MAAAVFEAQNKSTLRRWLGEYYLGREKLVTLSARGRAYIRGALRILKNKPPPCLGHSYC